MIEDKIFSEDDDEVEDEFPSKYDGKDWEPAHPYPDVNRHRDAHVSRYQQGERPEDSDVGAHSAKKMPTELVKTLSQNASIVGRNIGEHRVFTPTILVIL